MLKIRTNVPPPPARPLSPLAVHRLFSRLRQEFGLLFSREPEPHRDQEWEAQLTWERRNGRRL